MSRKRCFVNKKSGKKFEEIFDAFVVAKTAKVVSDVTTCSNPSDPLGQMCARLLNSEREYATINIPIVERE